jgi:hypothetical protein
LIFLAHIARSKNSRARRSALVQFGNATAIKDSEGQRVRTQVPEKLEEGRVRSGPWATTPEWGLSGVFILQAPSGAKLHVGGHIGDGKMVAIDLESGNRPGVLSASTGWEHVSVQTGHRTPTWDEMCFVKDLFWKEEECVVEYHPRLSEYVRCNPHCLHLWRPKHATIPTPPVSLAMRGF